MSKILDFNERCEIHPDHQQGMVTNQMIQARLHEEIEELRAALTRTPAETAGAVAYMTENEPEDMLFFDIEEARKYCDDDAEPIALCRCASLPSVPVSDERILELARATRISPIRGSMNNCEWLCVTPDLIEFARVILAHGKRGGE